jgi:hypothetical protein
MALEFDWVWHNHSTMYMGQQVNWDTLEIVTAQALVIAANSTDEELWAAKWVLLEISGPQEELDALDHETLKDIVKMKYGTGL